MKNTKRVMALVTASFASFAFLGAAMFAGACTGEEPGAAPATAEKDADKPDTLEPVPDTGPPPPVPKTVAGLALWLDASEPASVQRKNAGTDETVTKWLDKSGFTPPRNFAPAAGKAAPQFAYNAMRDKKMSAVFFTQSSQQYLEGPKFGGLSAAEVFIAVYPIEITPGGGAARPTYGLWQFGSYISAHPAGDNSIVDGFASVGAPFRTNQIKPEEMWTPHIFGATSTLQNWSAYYNGLPLQGATGDHAFGYNPAGALLGASNHGTQTIVPEAYFNGYIGEVLIYDHQLSQAEHDGIQSYLSAKWGIALKDAGP